MPVLASHRYFNQKGVREISKDKFIKHMAKTGEVTSIEWIAFLLEHYFMLGLSLEDYKKELVVNYEYGELYALACYEDAEEAIKQFIKKAKQKPPNKQ